MSSIILFLFLQGYDYLNQRDFSEALRYYEWKTKVSSQPDVHYNYGICALAEGRFEEAISSLRRVLDTKPNASYYLGVAYYRLSKYDSALYYFSRLKRDIKSARYYLGLIKLKQGRIEQAKRCIDSLPDSDIRSYLSGYIEDLDRLQSARERFIKGDYKGAIELYRKVSGLSGYRQLGCARTLIELHQYKKAKNILDSLITMISDSSLYSLALLEAGRLSYRARNLRRAKKYLKEYLTIRTSNTANFLMGKVLSDEGRYREAARYFRRLPDSVDAFLFYKGRTDYFLGFWGRAEEQLMRHREIFPNSKYADRAVYILASINFKRKEYESAIDFWEELVRNFPGSNYIKAAKIGIGNAYYNMKKYRKALSTYLEARKEKKSLEQDPQLNLKIYETRYRLGYYRSLVEALRRYLRDYPDSPLGPRVRLRIAQILFNQKSYYPSLSEIETIIRKYPDAPEREDAFFQKARLCRIINDRKGLKHSLKELLKNRRKQEYYLYALNELGGIYLDEMKYDSSLYYFNLLLDSDKYREKAIMDIAHIYETLNRMDEAETMVDRLIKDFPESIFIVDAYMLKSQLHQRKGDYDNAIEILNELSKKVGKKPEIYIEIGKIYFQMENFIEARKNYLLACEQYRQKRDDAAQALLLAGDASVALGEMEKAKQYYLRANLIAESPILKNKAVMKISKIGEE